MYKNKNWHEKRKSYTIRLTNSIGTNKTDISNLSDIIIAVYNDGSFFFDKKTALKNIIKNGDGYLVKINSSDIIAITEKNKIETKNINFKEKIMKQIINLI